MARLRGSLVCDGCDAYFDGDLVAVLGVNDALAATLKNPKNRKMVQDFWLCTECAPNYIGGAENWFSADVWADDPVCDECSEEYVDEWGHVCDYCDDAMSDNR
jgi:hypothetical protein